MPKPMFTEEQIEHIICSSYKKTTMKNISV